MLDVNQIVDSAGDILTAPVKAVLGLPPGAATYVTAGDSAAVIQEKLDSVASGDSLVFPGNSTFDFGGATIVGKSGVTVWADGPVTIQNAPGAGSAGAFDFSDDTNWSVRGRAAGEGFIFDGSLVNATNASDWSVGNNQFIGQISNGYDGSAVRMNGASYGTVINNDFTDAGGNVLGMYNLDHITFDGNHFVDCWQPISVQEPTTADTSLGRDIVVQRNVFLGTERVPIEMGAATTGAEYFSGLLVDNNYIDHSNNTADSGTLMGISLVGQAAENTTVTNNFIRRGDSDAGKVGVAIEMTGTGVVADNVVSNMPYAALTYQSGWDVSNNTVHNDGSSPYYGFANNGSGWGTFANNPVSSVAPAIPAMPERTIW